MTLSYRTYTHPLAHYTVHLLIDIMFVALFSQFTPTTSHPSVLYNYLLYLIFKVSHFLTE